MSGIVEAISNAVKSGINQDWVSMGTSIADALAKGVDAIIGLIG
ncbi:beta-class phenol-soluble modulin [Staphylococcus xylosus]|nr:beta-class phenol-soluble modulin [Staphylococcus xylosus]MEB8101085.1 beta-class phenol-soluble modulin [Staphylococcus xylosus]